MWAVRYCPGVSMRYAAVLCLAVSVLSMAGCQQRAAPGGSLIAEDGGLRITEHEVALTPANVADVLASEKPVLVDFSAAWCGPCLALMPEVQTLAEERHGELVVAIVDATDSSSSNQTLVDKFNVQGFPSLFVIKDQTVVGYSAGAPAGSLSDWVDAQLD